MARLINNELLFIHIAKTGGTLFRESINAYGIPNVEIGEKHQSLSGVQTSFPDLQFKKAIGFIRLPHNWYRSRWAYAKMTYFAEKIKYMPEAQKHWMAKVWNDDLNVFVENTLKVFPGGIATEYFSDMLKNPVVPVSILKYENIHSEILDVVSGIEHSVKRISKLQNNKPLDSKHIGGTISPELIKEIEKVEYLIYKHY